MNKLILCSSLVVLCVFLGGVNAYPECNGADGCFEKIVENEDETLPPPPPPPPCPATCLFSGVFDFPHFTSCDRFYRCLHGFFFDMACPAGQGFDHGQLRCVDVDEADCILEHNFHGN